jgi:RNA-directed DNA polymerase
LNRTLRGWANYFRHGVSKAVFAAIDHHAWHRIVGWIFRKHSRLSWQQLRRRFCLPGTWKLACNGVEFAGTSRVRRRGHRNRQPPPQTVDHRVRHVESPVHGDMHAGFGGRVRETD